MLALIAASAVVLRADGARPENVVFRSLAVGAAGLVGFALYRTLRPLALAEGDRTPDMLGGRTLAALEREKALTLRALKDLEFDRAMKKVSEADWQEMTDTLRARALHLMRQLDQGHAVYREAIEHELERRRLAAGLAPAPVGAPSAAGVTGAPPAVACASCQAENDADALFCKRCGTRLGGAA